MQPLDVKLAYRHQPWCTIRLEVSHNELGDADELENRQLPHEITDIFLALGFPASASIPLMPLHFQIAQKLHGLTSQGSNRTRDLIDLQLLGANETIDFSRAHVTCERLFAYRKCQTWPPVVVKGENWESLYMAQSKGLPVLPAVDEAVFWANELIAKIAAS